jgi:uncharacterized protein YutE (UPF0331/DUF86 family)
MPRDTGYLLDILEAARLAAGYVRGNMIHEYDDVDRQVVWDTVQQHLPNLIETIQQFVPPPES